MAGSSPNLTKLMQNASQTQTHKQHRIHLSEHAALVLGHGKLFRHVNPDDFMWSGDGDRDLNVFVPFAKVMRRVPMVQVNLVGIDASHAQNLRLELNVLESSIHGFVVSIHTWQDTKLAGVNVSWIAVEQCDTLEPTWVSATKNLHRPNQ